jgi:hypothetical protein
MTYSVILHIQGEEPIVGEIDRLPDPSDLLLTVTNPRRMDGKDLHYLADNVITVIWPVAKLNFIEVIPTKEDEDIIGFVRE